jgi:hypothetical protein
MGFLDEVVKFLKSVLEYLSGPKTLDMVGKVAAVINVIVMVLDMFSSEPPSNIRKREYTWAMIKFLKLVPLAEFEKLVEAKRSGVLDKLEDFEMDAAIGIVLANHIKNKSKTATRPLGSKG